jgi:DNA repair exonuclease SbcCD ATPase subunit
MLRAGTFVLLAQANAAKQGNEVTPVQKVIELLTRLTAQVSKEGKEEAAQYDKFACFCKEQADEKSYNIQKSDARIETLEAEIEDLSGDITALDEDVVGLKEDLDTEKDERDAAQKERNHEVDEYTAEADELKEAIDAVDRAMRELQGSEKKVKDTKLLQSKLDKLSKRGFPIPDMVALQKPGDPADFKFQSGEIIETLRELSRTFKADLKTLDEEEFERKRDHEMVEGARSNKMKALEDEIDKKEQLSSQKSAKKAEDEGLLTEEETMRGDDQSFLDALTTKCEDKATLFDQRSKSRASELTALTEATGIMKGASKKYNANSKLVLAQKSPSFLQVVKGTNHVEAVVAFLNSRKDLLRRGEIKKLVAELVVGDDHFVKVRQLLQDLIAKLEDEADAEADQKSFCDEEMTKAVEKRDEQSTNREEAAANIDKTIADIKMKEKEIQEISVEVADLHKSLNEMTELRAEEKAQNEKTIEEAGAGSTAVGDAMEVLKDYYNSFLQVQRGPDRDGNTVDDLAPDTGMGGEEYHGNQDAAGGIMGMLEVIKSDFDRTVSSTEDQESEAQTAFEEEESNIKGEIDGKESEKEDLESDVKTAKSDHTGYMDDEKDAIKMHKEALKELEALKPACIDGDESYEQRKAEREKEIEGLKEAMSILENWQG